MPLEKVSAIGDSYLDNLALERPVDKILQEKNTHLRPHHHSIGRELKKVRNQATVIGLRVIRYDIFNLAWIKLILQSRHVQVPKLFVRGVDHT